MKEPGDDPGAPYARHHAIAAAAERMAAQLIGIDYIKYDNYLGDYLKDDAKE